MREKGRECRGERENIGGYNRRGREREKTERKEVNMWKKASNRSSI